MALPDYTTQDAATYKSNIDSTAAYNQNAFKESLAKLIHPDQSKGLQDLQRQGVYPVSFNQQWGGMGYGGLPDGTLGEVATGFIAGDGTSLNFTNQVSITYASQGFNVGQTTDVSSVWVKIFKVGDPTNNLELYIYSDTAGDPNAVITNGTATAQDGHLHTDNTDGDWVKFVFPIAPSLTGGTQYHIVMKSSGAVDAANYWVWDLENTVGKYPHGNRATGDATPTWTQTTTSTCLFLIEPATTILNSGLSGFDGAITSYEGASGTLGQSGGFYFKNSDLNHKRGTIHMAGTGWAKDKTFYDSGLGADNNRIVIRTNVTTGYAQVDLYENNETKHTVTGTTDISTGNHIVSVGYRAEGDGADFLKLYVDGVSEGTPLTSQTITLDRAFEDGHSTIGGGFPLAPTWTNDASDGTVLPSNAANGTFTFTGTGTEANCFIAGTDYWAQNGAGYGDLESGYYQKTTTFANDEVVIWANEIEQTTNGIANQECSVYLLDGSKEIRVYQHEYFIELNDGVNIGYIQWDCTKKTHYKLTAKGSDFYLYANGKLLFDGAGLLDAATATNTIGFGDHSTATTEKATVKWYYFKYYEGAHLPEYSDVQISEFAHWNDDQTSLLTTIYNAGSIQSVKSLAGMNENYVKPVKQVISVKGIISEPTTTSTTPVPLAEMSIFSFGNKENYEFNGSPYNAINNIATHEEVRIDGVVYSELFMISTVVANIPSPMSMGRTIEVRSGLHYVNTLFYSGVGTAIDNAQRRTLTVEAE